MLRLHHITLSRGTKRLLEKSSIMLHEKQKVGLIGHNGCGKSSLFALILGELQPDSGECQLHSQLRLSHLSQQLPDSTEPALHFVLHGDEDYFALHQQLQQAEQQENHADILHCHELMAQTGGYSKPAQAAAIMAGLGFTANEQMEPVNSFSGGWRMRLKLARCLMKPADLLLLDEPTNHLDMEAIFWLEKWLRQTPSSIIVISHDREFLDAFVTHILHIEHQTMNLYSGNYSCFEQTRAEQLALQQATYVKQQEKINHLMSYVNRFRAKASKAKQAQSRLKAISKMELLAQAQMDSPFSFDFFPCPKANNPLLHCEQVTAGYNPHKPVLQGINLTLKPKDRIALLGPNGKGKSTLIKTLTGLLAPLSGCIHVSANLKIAYYAQHQLDDLNLDQSPLETIQQLSPEAREQTIRNYLGGFNFIGEMATKTIHHFSGGEKARLALAKLVWLKPNLLLLDEPTNHLDLSMRAAIEIALQSYEGALILISHDRHLLRTTVDDFFLVYNKQVQAFKGDLDDYYQWLQNKSTDTSPQAKTQTPPIITHREQKNLQNRIKKLEQLMQIQSQELMAIETTLADEALYVAEQNNQLLKLLDQQKNLQASLKQAETEWLDISHQLEDD